MGVITKVIKLLGITPLEKIREEIAEVKSLNDTVQVEVEEMQKYILTANGEEKWFLCKSKKGGRRQIDSTT